MFGRFIYGQCSLAEAFWKFSFLGLITAGFIARLLMIFLKQSAGYETQYLQVLINNISFLSMNPTTFALLCFYTASFLAVIAYSVVCIVGMWNTYKEYEKSKILAIICMLLIWTMIYFTIKFSIY